MISQSALDDLREAISPALLRTDPDLLAGYAADQSMLTPAGRPALVALPTTLNEVREIMSWAHRHRVPVVTRGGGTGLSGGACAVDHCLVLSTERLTAIDCLDPVNRVAVVGAGVINADLNAAAAQRGLMFAPDPSSWQSCTIGGNIATNAGGLRCLRYGATRNAVAALDIVLADGRVLHTGGTTLKRSAGYDLTQLFIGSEGTLGVIVSATVRLQPLPPAQLTALATFASASAAAAAAADLSRAAITPTLLELLDATTVAALDAHRGTDFGAGTLAVLVTQTDQRNGAETTLRDSLAAGATDVAITDRPEEAEELLAIRRAAYPALAAMGRVLVEDVCVPRPSLASLVDQIEQIAADTQVTVAVVAHAGDGNAHPLIVVPAATDGEQRAWTTADRIFRAALTLGGTVSGEHGVGQLKKHWLREEIGPTAASVHEQIRALFDPHAILNPGVLLASPGPARRTPACLG